MRRSHHKLRFKRPLVGLATIAALFTFVGQAEAISPDNPYRTFNLSGINYGSMRWEQQRKQGRATWPATTNRSGQTVSGNRGLGTVSGGTVISRGGVVSGTRVTTPQRLFRRRR